MLLTQPQHLPDGSTIQLPKKGSKYRTFISYKDAFFLKQHFLKSHLAFVSGGNRFILWKTDINYEKVFSITFNHKK